MSELPPGWVATKLGDLGRWIGGGTPSKAVVEYWGGSIPWVSPKDMKVDRIRDTADHVSEEAIQASSTNLVAAGSVLVVTRSGILSHTLPVAVTDVDAALNQDLKALIPGRDVDSAYVAWALRSNARRVLDSCSKAGTTVANIDTKRLLDFEIPVAPLAEQRRIVAAIEEQFSRLDAAEGSLAAGRVRLNSLRAIAAGLIADPRWPVARLADVATVVSGQTPKSLTTLPDGPIPFYKVGDMNTANGAAMGIARGYLDDHLAATQKLTVRPIGTVIFPKRGGAIATNKKRILVRPSAFDLNTMGVVPGAELDQRYLLAWFETVDLNALADGSNVPQINHGDIEPLEIPLPPLDEQRRIVAEVEQQLSLIDALRAAVESAQKRSAALRRAILERAFRGELVPQDPADEPASVLLERIRAERASLPATQRRGRGTILSS